MRRLPMVSYMRHSTGVTKTSIEHYKAAVKACSLQQLFAFCTAYCYFLTVKYIGLVNPIIYL